MKTSSIVAKAALGSILSLSGVALGQATIKIDGSSTVYPISSAAAEEFRSVMPKVNVTVGESGTGGGFKRFVKGETDISDASRPITAKEMGECKTNGIEFIELPIAFDALTVVVNKGNTWLTDITIADLKKMWEPDAQGKITTWNQIRPEWPSEPIKLYGPGSASGTFDYFTEAVNGKSKASRGDYTASEDDNVLVQGVSKDKGGLGYFGFSYYAANTDKLKALAVVNKAGKAILPSEASVKDASYNPFSRPIFIYVNKKSLERAEVKKFVEFYITHATDLVNEVKYVPLPSDAYQKDLERLNKVQTGTAFGGHNQVGLHIDELFSRPLVTEAPAEKPGEKK